MNFIRMEIWQGNTVWELILMPLLITLGIVVIRIALRVIQKKLSPWAAEILNSKLSPLLYLVLIYLSFQHLKLPDKLDRLLDKGSVILGTLLLTRVILDLMIRLVENKLTGPDKGNQEQKSLKGTFTLVKIIVWVLAMIFLLDNLGFKISAVIAGLGIGGVAIALAAQAFLGDLFNYFAILFDKPFEIGDFVTVGSQAGTIENIGIKTTRIRSISGEQIILSNTDMMTSRVQNHKRMETRRVLFRLGVQYETQIFLLEEIPQMIRSIIESVPKARFERAHFASYGDFSLIFEVVYLVLDSDYNRYMDIQQKVNLEVFRKFKEKNIEFAYPTSTIHLKNMTGT